MKAQAITRGNRIVLLTTHDYGEFDATLARCKAVPGGRFLRSAGSWRYPLTVETCHALRRAWGKKLEVGSDLAEWYRAHQLDGTKQALRSTLSDAPCPRLHEVAPELWAAMRPDQRAGVQWIANAYRNGGVVADEPGLGKTWEVIGGLLERGVAGPVLVACPRLSVKAVWLKEFHKWAPHVPVFISRGNRARRQRGIDSFIAYCAENPDEMTVLVVVQDMLRVQRRAPDLETETKSKRKARGRVLGESYEDLFAGRWAAVVVDESQRMFGSLTVAQGTLAGEGVARLWLRDEALRLAVSATPFGKGGRVRGMFGTLHWLWPDEYTSFWRWAEENFDIVEERIPGRCLRKTAKKIGNLKGGQTEDDFFASLGPRLLRRTWAEVAPDMPSPQRTEILCEMDPAQTRQYSGMTINAEVVCPGGVLSVNGVLVERTRAKQMANGVVDIVDGQVKFTDDSCKIDMLMHILEKRGIPGTSGDKVVVASQFNEFLEAVQRRLVKEGVAYHLITGKVSDAKRDEMIQQWQEQEGGPRVFLLNAKAGGVSISLDASSEVHCLDELDNPEDMQQLEDRVRRSSRVHQVKIFYYRTEGTIDQVISEDVEAKRQQQFRTMDARRGLQYLREMVQYQKPAGDN